MGIRLVRGRALGGALGLAGVAALAPSIFWPTSSMTQTGAFIGEGKVEDIVSVSWSWGKYGVENAPEGLNLGDQMSNTVALVLLVLVVVLGAAGSAAWLLVRGVHGRLVGVAGTAVAATFVTQTVLQRLGQNLMMTSAGPADGIIFGTPPAGRFEQLAVALLLLALLVMLWRSLLGVGRTLWREAAVRAAAARVVDESPPGPDDLEGRGRVIVHGERGGTAKAVPPRLPGETPAEPVGFTDPPSDDDRFRPPKRP